jgi:hypothetical protein
VLTAVQVGLVALTAIGLVWVLVQGIGALVGAGAASAPSVGPISLPVLLLVGGAILGGVVALAARWFVRLGARQRRSRVAGQLRSAVSAVAVERVIAPVAAVVIDHRTVREALTRPR